MVEPKITVLMPVYNGERFLREAISSILLQTFQDFELLIIDDGSTDRSVEIIYSFDDPRIRLYFNEKNLGISETLNKGIMLASAELIARMDADDISDPFRLEKQYNYMLEHPECALLSTWARAISEDGRFVRIEPYRGEYYYYNLTFECWIYHPTVMFRKAPVVEVGMYIMPFSEDYDLFWRLSTRFEIGNIAQPLVNYRLSPTSLNAVLRKQEYEEANEQNVLRNIRFYMGERFEISKESLECLRHHFEPIIKKNNIDEVLATLDVLDAITERILERENPNRSTQSIREAHYYKRRFILTQLAHHMPVMKKLLLVLRTREWLVGYMLCRSFIREQLKKVKSFFLSF
jgi:glycosyltransferase involved in cell wall biosynthesis